MAPQVCQAKYDTAGLKNAKQWTAGVLVVIALPCDCALHERSTMDTSLDQRCVLLSINDAYFSRSTADTSLHQRRTALECFQGAGRGRRGRACAVPAKLSHYCSQDALQLQKCKRTLARRPPVLCKCAAYSKRCASCGKQARFLQGRQRKRRRQGGNFPLDKMLLVRRRLSWYDDSFFIAILQIKTKAR